MASESRAASPFPSTSWSLIRKAADPTAEGAKRLERLLSIYWRPVYCYMRARWGKTSVDAEDLTQGFFAGLLESDGLAKLAPGHGSFRSFLKASLNHFVIDDHRRQRALKRGAALRRVPMDISKIESTLPDPSSGSPEALFDREWIRRCLDHAVRILEEALLSEGRGLHLKIFNACYEGDGREPKSHEELAKELGLRKHDVGNHLRYVRRKLRTILKEVVRDYTSSEKDAIQELGFVLGEEGRG